MTSPQCLPPTSRDFLVYERIIIERATTRQAAEEAGLSQTRVRQIVHRVEEYLAGTLATADREGVNRGRLRLAQCVAADRLQDLYSEALERWHATQETKYFTVVLRLIAAQAKLAAQPFTLAALAADALEGPLPEEPPASAADIGAISAAAAPFEPATPPIEDCSTLSPTAATQGPAPRSEVAATSTHEISSDHSLGCHPPCDAPRNSTAQLPLHSRSAIAELRLSPDEIVLTGDLVDSPCNNP
jgi:hypothetical protein